MLSLQDLQNQIKRGELLPFYVFTGEEIELQNIYLRKMGNVIRIDNVADVYAKLTSKMMWKKSNNVYAVRDDAEFIKNEKAWSGIQDKIKNGTLVIQITTPDKRSKFLKAMTDCTVEFKHMTTGQLVGIVNREVKGSQGVITYFIESCNNDYNTILNYLDIFKRLGYDELTKHHIDEFIERPMNVTVFNLADAIMQLDAHTSYRMLDELLVDSNNAMGIIYAIANQLHKCVVVEGYRGEKDIAKKTGINGWICNTILNYNNIPPSKLLKALRIVQKYDKGIKTGVYEQKHACYCLVTEILSQC